MAEIEREHKEPGIYYDLSFEEYLRIDAINNSVLKVLTNKSPKHARHAYLYSKETPCLAFGRLAHTLLLRPDQFDSVYSVGPDVRRNANEWKAFAKLAESVGKEPIKPSDYDIAKAFVDAVKKQYVYRFVNKGNAEVALVWRDDEPVDIGIEIGDLGYQEFHFEPTGLLCKALVDYEHKESMILVDLKSTRDAKLELFKKDSFNLQYYQQAAMSSDGWEKLTGHTPVFDFLAVEKCPKGYDPSMWHYDSVILEVQPRTIAHSQVAWRRALLRWANCLETNNWPGYADDVVPLELDDWMLSKILAGGVT